MDDKLIVQFSSNALDDISNKFMHQIYNFYYEKGLKVKVIKEIVEILSLIFGIVFSVYFFILIDWSKILTCQDEKSCERIGTYITFNGINIYQFGLIFLSFLFLLYKIINLYSIMKDFLKVKDFYEYELDIRTDNIYNMNWNKILNKLSIKYKRLDKYEIIAKIMNDENYLISMIDNKVIKVPSYIITKQFILNLKLIFYNEFEKITLKNLKRKLLLQGIINLLFLPFIITFHIIYFILVNIEDFYSNKSVLGPRRYTELAKWKFRTYNELPHYFEERINMSVRYANEYVRHFETPILETICKFIILISGSLFSLFLFMSILDENILLYVKFLDRSLIFYTGIVSAISSFARTYIREPEDSIYKAEEMMENIVEYTYYFPNRWKGKCNKREIRDEFLKFYQYKICIFMNDIISSILIPYYLIVKLPRESQEILNYIRLKTVDDDNLGKICVYSRKYEDFEDNKLKNSLIRFRERHLEEIKV